MSEIAQRHPHQMTYDRTEREVEEQVSGWAGWIGFGSFMLMLAGIFQAIYGLVGLFRESYYAVATNSNQLLILHSVHNWGWANLIIGIVLILAGVSLLSGSLWARVIAVIVAMFAAVANLLTISIYPIWSLLVIGLSVLVMYAVIVHGSELKHQ